MVRRNADEFCQHCDYPLFWAPSSAPVASPGANSQSTLRRLPGAGGRHRVGTRTCAACGELNPIARTHCIRCDSELDPKPPAPSPPPPAAEPEPLVEVREPEPIGTRWDFWALGALLVVTMMWAVVANL